MNKDFDYYMNLKYKIEIIEDKDEGGYVLLYPELKGCVTCADTIEQGVMYLQDAKKEWIYACLEDGIPIPEPHDINEFSGNLRLRMPKSLHMKLSQNADKEGISMNQYIIYLLSKGIVDTTHT